MELRYELLDEDSARTVASWFDGDAEGQRRFGEFYGVHPNWWDLVRDDESRHGWTVHDQRETVGFLDMDIDDRRASISLYIVVDRRGGGFGREVAADALRLAAGLDVEWVEAAIDPDNEASIRACRGAGYRPAGSNRFGDLVLVAQTARAPT